MLKKPVHIHWCYILSDQRSATLTVILLTFQLICWSAQRGLVDYPVNTFCMARDFSGSLMISVGGTTGVVCRKNSSLSSTPPPPCQPTSAGDFSNYFPSKATNSFTTCFYRSTIQSTHKTASNTAWLPQNHM